MVSIDHLNLNISQLKLAISNPCLYLANYFSELVNKIDTECQKFLNDQTAHLFVLTDHEAMIDEIKRHESECFTFVSSEGVPENLLNELNKEIECVKKKLSEETCIEYTDEINNQVCSAFNSLQSYLLMNRELRFYERKKILEKIKEFKRVEDEKLCSMNTFGILLDIQANYIGYLTSKK